MSDASPSSELEFCGPCFRLVQFPSGKALIWVPCPPMEFNGTKLALGECGTLAPWESASVFRRSANGGPERKGGSVHPALDPRLGLVVCENGFDRTRARVIVMGPENCPPEWHQAYRFNEDGTLSPCRSTEGLVLGFGKCYEPKHGFKGKRNQAILVERDDERRLLVTELTEDETAAARTPPPECPTEIHETGIYSYVQSRINESIRQLSIGLCKDYGPRHGPLLSRMPQAWPASEAAARQAVIAAAMHYVEMTNEGKLKYQHDHLHPHWKGRLVCSSFTAYIYMLVFGAFIHPSSRKQAQLPLPKVSRSEMNTLQDGDTCHMGGKHCGIIFWADGEMYTIHCTGIRPAQNMEFHQKKVSGVQVSNSTGWPLRALTHGFRLTDILRTRGRGYGSVPRDEQAAALTVDGPMGDEPNSDGAALDGPMGDEPNSDGAEEFEEADA
mmetsp:Transcript_92313/g.287736  ORF Transcript_92313/g.287736 Transcript_92313/m.287736 type:complete len:442 (-) Transcript_92313:46-1371(-)